MKEQLATAAVRLGDWYHTSARPLPWRRDCDPYHVWLSEIMLQQTRVEAVIPYYERFLTVFPDVTALANAPDDLLMKCWEGLGYYSRARNLKKAAIQICEKFGGIFPAEYTSLLSLPGIGAYTAGAIGSISFGLPTPAVDGNVLRILARLFADERDILTQAVKQEYQSALQQIYPSGEKAGMLTQSFMELGQTHCLPNGKPKCAACPLEAICEAHQKGLEESLPRRAPKKARKIQKKTVFLLHMEDGFILHLRPKEGLLGGLWEFPNTDGHLTAEEAATHVISLGLSPLGVTEVEGGKHIFTHLEWHMKGYFIECENTGLPKGFVLATPNEVATTYAIASAFSPFRRFTEQE